MVHRCVELTRTADSFPGPDAFPFFPLFIFLNFKAFNDLKRHLDLTITISLSKRDQRINSVKYLAIAMEPGSLGSWKSSSQYNQPEQPDHEPPDEDNMSPAERAAAAALRRQEEYAREMAGVEAAPRKEKVGRDTCKRDGRWKQKDVDDDAESMMSRAFSSRSLKGVLRNRLERARNKFEGTRDKLREKAEFDKLDSGWEGERESENEGPLMSGDLVEENGRGNESEGLDAYEDEVREVKRKTKRKNRSERRHTRRDCRGERRRHSDGEKSESEQSNDQSYHISYGPVGAWECTVM